MKITRCDVTGELLVRLGDDGVPLFGVILPFLGWKWIACNRDGSVSDGWPPYFKSMKFGFMWLGAGWFYTPPNPRVVPISQTTTA